MTKKSLVLGCGINDADYPVGPKIDGKQLWCPIYLLWRGMLKRCFDKKYQSDRPSYKGCSICPEWILFSNFKAWVEKQDWQGKALDKDLLEYGNKVYSPDKCIFVSEEINSFMTDSFASRGEWPLGVSWHKQKRKFRAQCNNPFTKKREHLGLFDCPNEAHVAWKQRKAELACELAAKQENILIAKGLRERYSLSTTFR